MVISALLECAGLCVNEWEGLIGYDVYIFAVLCRVAQTSPAVKSLIDIQQVCLCISVSPGPADRPILLKLAAGTSCPVLPKLMASPSILVSSPHPHTSSIGWWVVLRRARRTLVPWDINRYTRLTSILKPGTLSSVLVWRAPVICD